MLHERTKARKRVVETPSLQTPPPALEIVAVDPGRGNSAGIGKGGLRSGDSALRRQRWRRPS